MQINVTEPLVIGHLLAALQLGYNLVGLLSHNFCSPNSFL